MCYIIRHVANYRNEGPGVREVIGISRALSDPNRVRTLAALRKRELCVCQIVELLGLAPSTVSKHMSILTQAGLVESRREGRWIYYRRADHEISITARGALVWLDDAGLDADALQPDGVRLATILAIPPEDLCRRHLDPRARGTVGARSDSED